MRHFAVNDGLFLAPGRSDRRQSAGPERPVETILVMTVSKADSQDCREAGSLSGQPVLMFRSAGERHRHSS